ncbi:MAG: hypothetical protein M3Z66_12045 [Chloroflexota bacterium]|nr:hypothetical protein [Chloroflexota bacterium]
MRSVSFSIPSIQGADRFVDLGSILTSLSGVASLTVDQEAHVVSVEYDPAFTGREVIAHAITGAGYPIGPG